MAETLRDYVLEAEVGRGAMGAVWRARHTPTNSTRAIKVIATTLDSETIARFKREAEALARAGGNGVVPIHEVGSERGRLFLAMSFMPGGSLRARVKQGPMPWREAVAIARDLAHALERCHAAGLVHRDLKPDNVLFDDEGRPRLADFGLVRDLGSQSLTQSGTLLGTPIYMTPEVMKGARADAGSDLYALALVLHEMVAGVAPHFARRFEEVSALKLSGKRPRLTEIAGAPPELDVLIDRALAPRPADRYGHASDLARDLEALLVGEKLARKTPRWVLRALAGGAVLVAGLAIFAFGRPQAPPPPPAPPALPPPPARKPEHSEKDKATEATYYLDRAGDELAIGRSAADIQPIVLRALALLPANQLPRDAKERLLAKLRKKAENDPPLNEEESFVIEGVRAIRVARSIGVELHPTTHFVDCARDWARRFRKATDSEWTVEGADAFLLAASDSRPDWGHYAGDAIRGACALRRARPELAPIVRENFDVAIKILGSHMGSETLRHSTEFLASEGRWNESLGGLLAALESAPPDRAAFVARDPALALYRGGWPPKTAFDRTLVDKLVAAAPDSVELAALRAFVHAGNETGTDVAALEAATAFETSEVEAQARDGEIEAHRLGVESERGAALRQLADVVARDLLDPRRKARILVRLGRVDDAAKVLEEAPGDLAKLAPLVRKSKTQLDREQAIELLSKP